MDIEESFVPQEIKDKIEMLNKMIGEAESLNKVVKHNSIRQSLCCYASFFSWLNVFLGFV